MIHILRWPAIAAGLVLVCTCMSAWCAQQPDVQSIIQNSVAANEADFKAAPEFNYKETDRAGKGSKTYQITMIEGSPYQRLIAINGEPLSKEQQAAAQQKQQQEIQKRRSESSAEKEERIAKYEKDRKRDHEMMNQLTEAFRFTFIGEKKLRGFDVYVLKATPRPGYNPPNMETQVLPGMEGMLWIDQKTFQWVKVTARVIHPVSIEGFLARVEPGTAFELENGPVPGGSWQAKHFSMRSKARVLDMFQHGSQQDSTYFDYQKANEPSR